ncbi:MAG: LysR family transcriptional regulator [Gammaproteobacteria bacterium]|nr:MAG: LysR family transcriptional regulator [Gammaproteobacteria bacterium]
MSYSAAENLIRHLSLRQLQIFEAVVRLGGYSKAADSLHLTQPTISMQVKKLTETIGQPLLERQGNRLCTTAVGEEVFLSAQTVLGHISSLGESALALQGAISGPLKIAVITTAKYFMPHLLGKFIHLYPDVHPLLKVTNRSRVIERLKLNEDDLLIMGQVPQSLNVRAYPFADNELVVVASPGHRLANRHQVKLEELLHERFLVREQGSGTRLAIDRVFADKGLSIDPYMELGSSEAIKQAVMADLGISVLSRRSLKLELECNQIAILNVRGFPLVRRWYAVHNRHKKLSLAAQTFLEFLLEQGDLVSDQPR